MQILTPLTLSSSMMLINSLLSHASDLRWEEFIAEMERLNMRKAVVVRQLSFHLRRLPDHPPLTAPHVATYHGRPYILYS